PVLNRDIEARGFCDSKVTDCRGGRLDGILCRRLPGVRARSDDLGDAVDAFAHFSVLLFVAFPENLLAVVRWNSVVISNADPTDRRVALICLTDRCWDQIRAALAILAAIEDDSARRIGKHRVEPLGDVRGEPRATPCRRARPWWSWAAGPRPG